MLPKYLLQLDVTEGIDIGLRVWLAGSSLTIGSFPDDDLCLSDAEILKTHLTCTRDKKGWRFEVNSATELSHNGKIARSGYLRKGDRLALGASTVLTVFRRPIPDALKYTMRDEKEDGLSPLMSVLLLSLFAATAVSMIVLTRPAPLPKKLPIDFAQRNTILVENFGDCVFGLEPPSTELATTMAEPSQLYWRIASLLEAGDTQTANTLAGALYAELETAIRQGSALESMKDASGAIIAFRRVDFLLPNIAANGSCKIVDQIRKDIAKLDNQAKGR